MYHRIRVRPIVRYSVIDYIEDGEARRSMPLGEYDNVGIANRVGAALTYEARVRDQAKVEFEPARALRIETVRAPGLPRPAVRWELREVTEASHAQ